MDKEALKRTIENIILDNDIDEKFCQLYENVLDEIDNNKFIFNIAHKLSPIETPIIIISLKKKRNRPAIFITVGKNGIIMKFVFRIFIGVPINKMNYLIEDCYYNRNKSGIAHDYYEELF